MKKWRVDFELDMMAEKTCSVIVKANTERKAKIIAQEKLEKTGDFFLVKFLRCEEVNSNE